MAITAADVEEFIALVQRDASLRERVRKALIEDAFERIAAAMAQSAGEAATAGAVAAAASDVVLFLDRKDPAEPIATA